MKRYFSKPGNREKLDKIDRKASTSGATIKEKSSKRRLSIYDDFEDEEMDELDPKLLKNMKSRR